MKPLMSNSPNPVPPSSFILASLEEFQELFTDRGKFFHDLQVTLQKSEIPIEDDAEIIKEAQAQASKMFTSEEAQQTYIAASVSHENFIRLLHLMDAFLAADKELRKSESN